MIPFWKRLAYEKCKVSDKMFCAAWFLAGYLSLSSLLTGVSSLSSVMKAIDETRFLKAFRKGMEDVLLCAMVIVMLWGHSNSIACFLRENNSIAKNKILQYLFREKFKTKKEICAVYFK